MTAPGGPKIGPGLLDGWTGPEGRQRVSALEALGAFRSTKSSSTGYHQLAAPAPVSVPSAFNENSALEWTYADAQGKHAVYVSSLGADGWIISAQAPTLETAIADGSTVFNSMTRN